MESPLVTLGPSSSIRKAQKATVLPQVQFHEQQQTTPQMIALQLPFSLPGFPGFAQNDDSTQRDSGQIGGKGKIAGSIRIAHTRANEMGMRTWLHRGIVAGV